MSMRLEVIIGNEEPRIYPLNRQKLIIGSLDTCDIVINHKGISRKHIIINSVDDKFFILDQGSTNGTYINEQRLVPGRASEFTSFFPVRLGDDVLITLLSDEEADYLGPISALNNSGTASAGEIEKTKMISLTNLQKSSTANLVKKRTESVAKRKTQQKIKQVPKKEKNLSNNVVGALCLLIVVGAGYYQMSKNKSQELATEALKEVRKPQNIEVVQRPIERVALDKVPAIETLIPLISQSKCSTEIEKYLCVTLPSIFQGVWGTVLQENNIVIFADGVQFSNGAKNLVKSDSSPEQVNSDLALLRLIFWIKENVPESLTALKEVENFTITIAFVDKSSETPAIISGAILTPDSLLQLRQKIQPIHFENARVNGPSEFSYAIDYLRFL